MDASTQTDPVVQSKSIRSQLSKWLMVACAVTTASSSFHHGYGIGVHNQLSPYIDQTFHITQNRLKNISGEFFNGIPQFVLTLGNLWGALTGMWWYRLFCFNSRRKLFYANLTIGLISVLIVWVSFYTETYSVYIVSRLLHGYQGGMACSIVPPYLVEISPRPVRGAVGTIHQLLITVGILASQLIGIPQLFGRTNSWPTAFLLGGVTSILGLILTRFLPDSPTEAIYEFKDEGLALINLKKLRKDDHVASEMSAIHVENISASKPRKMSTIMLFQSRFHKWPFFISLTLLGGQALCGINAIFYYSDYIFRTPAAWKPLHKSGIRASKRPACIFFTGLTNLISTVIAIELMELLGRRTLIVYSCGCMTIISGLMPLLIALNASFHIRYLAWITVSLIMAYVACFAIGMGPIPYIYASEVFRHDIRNKALVSGLLLNYSFNLIVSLVFPLLNNLMGGYVFLVFMVIMAAQTTLYFFKMAETKNKSIEEIEEFWTKGKTDNDIREEEDVQ